MADSFYVVSVRTNDERSIVVGVIVRAQTWCAIVLPAGFESCTVELIDLPSIGRCESKM
jgi:hypothetical protein